MEERRAMGSAGAITVLLSLRGGRLKSPPRIVSNGVFEDANRRRAEQKVGEHVRNRLKGQRFSSTEDAQDAAIEAARRFLMHNHRVRPLITADTNGEA
jgi:mRNA degradation ribonuclease J1/J2